MNRQAIGIQTKTIFPTQRQSIYHPTLITKHYLQTWNPKSKQPCKNRFFSRSLSNHTKMENQTLTQSMPMPRLRKLRHQRTGQWLEVLRHGRRRLIRLERSQRNGKNDRGRALTRDRCRCPKPAGGGGDGGGKREGRRKGGRMGPTKSRERERETEER